MAKSPTLTGADPFNLVMTDDALVTFGAPVGPGALQFHDVGFMPVTQLTIGGDLQQLKGKLDGLFIRYAADGVQYFDAKGAPVKADYTKLSYDLVGYKGDATFGHAADGTPTVTDAKHITVLAHGDATMGHLAFGVDGSITGQVHASMQIDNRVVGALEISVQHGAGDVHYPATGGLTLDGGMLQADFMPLATS